MKQASPNPAASPDATAAKPDASVPHPALAADAGPTVNLAPDLGEEADENGDAEASQSYEMPGRAWEGWLFALVPFVVILLGAGREAWSKGLASVLMGLLVVAFPARRRLPLFVTVCLLGALLAPLLAFLPSGWQGQLPAWRPVLEDDWGIRLSHTVTPQAWVTWEAWVSFSLSLLWLGWCLARGFSAEQRRALMQGLAMGGIMLCTLAILEYQRWITIPWWPRNPGVWGDGFGPFANRNHSSSLAAITCLLAAAAAHDANRRRSRTWTIYVLGLLPPLACIFTTTSKAGVLLLFVGFTTWFGTVAMRKSFFQKMAMASTLICIIAALILMSEGGVSTRLKSGEYAGSSSLRFDLLFETLSMAAHSPWLGVGLGNFEAVFPLVTGLHQPASRFLHPESDLLWLLAEGGLLTFVPAVLLVVWIFTSTGPWFGKKKKGGSSRQDRRLRNAAAIAFGLGVLHGIGDVPNHALGYAVLMALLAGMAVRPRRLPQTAGWLPRLGFRAAGLGMLAAGASWIGVALGHGTLPGTSAAEAASARASELAGSGSIADGIALMDEAIHLTPMNFQRYYERARMILFSGGSKDDALMDFSRSRALEPHYAALCYQEGVTWLDFDAQYAIIGWREFLRRAPAAAPGIWGYFRQMLNHASRHPELQEPLWSLATTAELKLDYLATVTGTKEEFGRRLRSLLAQMPQLEGMESSQRETLFELWSRLGDEKALMTALETNPKWRDDGWRLLASYHARESDFRSACQTAAAYLPSLNRSAPGASADIPSLERALLYNPTDARAGIELFQAQKNSGDLDGALRTLEKVAALPNPPVYVRQEMAALHMAKEDYRRAWEQYQVAMQRQS